MSLMENKLTPMMLSAAALLLVSGCSTLSKDDSVETKALTAYATPDLSGQWVDEDYPTLGITMQQNDARFSFTRKGVLVGNSVDETHNGSLKGLSVASTYLSRNGSSSPLKGRCFGSVDEKSVKMTLNCEDVKSGSYTLNLQKL